MALSYTPAGKPQLLHSNLSVSISHSAELVSVIASEAQATGIDIEPVKPRIVALAHKFLSPSELNNLEEHVLVDQLHVYWGAKEALYKLHGEKGLIFSEELLIHPFQFNSPEGKIKGSIQTKKMRGEFELSYEKILAHMLVYVTNS